jgi:hypothetical protein
VQLCKNGFMAFHASVESDTDILGAASSTVDGSPAEKKREG